MKIVCIGSGNVATHTAKALKEAGNTILQVYSRTREHADLLATAVGAESIDDLENIDRNADFYLFSVKDDALPDLVFRMPATTGIWAHTAGSIPVSVLSPHCKRGVIYPLQTFSRDRNLNFREIPLFIEGEDDETTHVLKRLAETISGNVRILSGDKRRVLHLAAVFACNFTNHMYALASQVVEEENLPFHLLNALITETAAKVGLMSPYEAQTGPAVRLDETTMKKHLALLKDPDKKRIYALLSENIHKINTEKLSC